MSAFRIVTSFRSVNGGTKKELSTRITRALMPSGCRGVPHSRWSTPLWQWETLTVPYIAFLSQSSTRPGTGTDS